MKKSELRRIVQEAIQGYSKYTGKTQGGTTGDFRNILTAIAKGTSEEDSEEEKVKRGHAILDKADQEKVAQILRGEKPVYNEGQEQNYLVSFTVGEDEDDVEVKANSPEEAIEKVKSGEVELAYGQKVPRIARAFSAKVWNK